MDFGLFIFLGFPLLLLCVINLLGSLLLLSLGASFRCSLFSLRKLLRLLKPSHLLRSQGGSVDLGLGSSVLLESILVSGGFFGYILLLLRSRHVIVRRIVREG